MSDMLEKLWPAFYAEVSEQLEHLELSLLEYETKSVIDVDGIFREFHTIKSSCSMMAFTSMEEIAHASEDLLDLVRAGKAKFDHNICDILLKAVDRLKQQLEEVGETKENPVDQADLVAELCGICNRYSKGDDSAVLDNEESNNTPGCDHDESHNGTITEDLLNESASNDASIERHNYEGFSEIVQSEFPKILLVKPLENKKEVAALVKTRIDLQNEAKKIGFHSISNLLDKLIIPIGDEAEYFKTSRLRLYADMLDRFRYVESNYNLDCGADEASHSLKTEVMKDFGRVIQNLILEVTKLKEAYSEVEKSNIKGIVVDLISKIDQVVIYSKLIGLTSTIQLLLFVRQILREVKRHNTELNKTLLDLISMACGLASEIDGDNGEDGPYTTICQQLLSELKAAASESASSEKITETQDYIRKQIDINSEFISILTLKALGELVNAIKQRKNIFEIEADLEASHETGEEFIKWLSKSGSIISNRTIFHRTKLGDSQIETTKLRFLIAFDISVEEIKTTLGEMDPDRKLFEQHHCKYIDEIKNEQNKILNSLDIKKVSFPGATNAANDTLRVGSNNLDQFVNQVGELVMLQNMMSHALYENHHANNLNKSQNMLRKLEESSDLNKDELHNLRISLGNLEEYQQEIIKIDMRLKNTLGYLQEGVMALRVVPVAMVFNRLPRMVRDLSSAHGKKVQIDIVGEDVQIDKGLVEVLVEPLMHMVRNCIDHGIETPEERLVLNKPETAILSLNAKQQNGSLIIEIADDGKGLDYEKILQQAIKRGLIKDHANAPLSERELGNLIFMPGFSTSEEVTETSGRGVGMDVVKTKITQMGGLIDTYSISGEGTTFVLRLPLSVAIQGVVLVSSASQQLAIPERNVSEVIMVSDKELQLVQGQAAIMLRNMTLPIYRLDKLMGKECSEANKESEITDHEVVIINNGIHRIGVIVDKILERQELFVRDLHADLGAIPCIGSVSILGDGSVVIILDCENLFELAANNAQSLRTFIHA